MIGARISTRTPLRSCRRNRSRSCLAGRAHHGSATAGHHDRIHGSDGEQHAPGIVAGPDGNLWFSEFVGGRSGR